MFHLFVLLGRWGGGTLPVAGRQPREVQHVLVMEISVYCKYNTVKPKYKRAETQIPANWEAQLELGGDWRGSACRGLRPHPMMLLILEQAKMQHHICQVLCRITTCPGESSAKKARSSSLRINLRLLFAHVATSTRVLWWPCGYIGNQD